MKWRRIGYSRRMIPSAARAVRAGVLLAAVTLAPNAFALSEQAKADADTMLAEMTLSRGDCRGASERYARLSTQRKDAALAKRATLVAAECHHLDAEIKSARRWSALEPQSAEAARAFGLAALKLDRIDEARTAFAAVHRAGGTTATLETLPLATDAGGTWGAFAALRPIFDAEKSNVDLLMTASEAALDAFDFAAAQRYAERALAEEPASGDARARLASALAARGDAVKAIALAREAVALSPSTERFAVVDALARLDRLDEAARELEGYLSDGEARSEAQMRLARLAYQRGSYEDAKRRFSELLDSRDGAGEAFYFLSLIAERQQNKDLALEGYRRLASAGAGLPARMRAAKLLLERGERDAAFKLLDALAEKERGAALEVELAKASLLDDVGKHADALTLLDAAAKRFADHPNVRYQRALALDKAARDQDSIRVLEALLKDRPNDPSLLNALGYSLADDNRELPRAEKLIQQALNATPDNPAYLDSLGWVRFRRGDPAGALPLLERAYRIFPDAEIAAHLGEVLWRLDRKSEAQAIWTRAFTRAPDSDVLKATVTRLTGAPPVVAPPTDTSSI
jgi:tetratricopeptide (TPR) repeat protein